jgi:hypothetical protein
VVIRYAEATLDRLLPRQSRAFHPGRRTAAGMACRGLSGICVTPGGESHERRRQLCPLATPDPLDLFLNGLMTSRARCLGQAERAPEQNQCRRCRGCVLRELANDYCQ